MSKKFEKNLIPFIKRKHLKKFFAGEVFLFILIPELPTYGFFRRLRIAFQTCTQIFLTITWQPCLAIGKRVSFHFIITPTKHVPIKLNSFNSLKIFSYEPV